MLKLLYFEKKYKYLEMKDILLGGGKKKKQPLAAQPLAAHHMTK